MTEFIRAIISRFLQALHLIKLNIRKGRECISTLIFPLDKRTFVLYNYIKDYQSGDVYGTNNIAL